MTSPTSAVFAQLQHSDLGTVLPDQHHNKLHEITYSAHHNVVGTKYRVPGAVADNTLGLLTPLHDVSAERGVQPAAQRGRRTRPQKSLQHGLSYFDSDLNQVRILSGNILKSDNYASQLTGWGIDYRGAADFRGTHHTDELHARAFITDLEQALAGGQIISKSVAVLAEDFVLPGAGGAATLRVADLPSAPNMAVFVAGDLISACASSHGRQSFADDCRRVGVATAYSDGSGANEGTQTWTFTRVVVLQARPPELSTKMRLCSTMACRRTAITRSTRSTVPTPSTHPMRRR